MDVRPKKGLPSPQHVVIPPLELHPPRWAPQQESTPCASEGLQAVRVMLFGCDPYG